MDMQMPVMDGLEATLAIHALPGQENLPILAMTANAFEDDRQRCMEVGMCDHVAKPVDPDQLYQALLRWLPVPNDDLEARQVRVALEDLPALDDDAQLLERLRALEGLDVAAGMKTLRNKFPSYKRLLGQFALHHRGDMGLARQCLAEGRLEEANRVAHTLKGAAASLGVWSVQEAAQNLETAIRELQPEAELLRLTDGLEVVLADMADALAAILPQSEH
jgi:CheY-like chemotaxis protein